MYMYIYIYIHTHTYKYAYTYTYTDTQSYPYVYVCVYAYAHAYTCMQVSNLSKSITSHKIQSDLNEAQLQYRKEAFNATHSVFAIESRMLAEEIATLRKALARTQTKVLPVYVCVCVCVCVCIMCECIV